MEVVDADVVVNNSTSNGQLAFLQEIFCPMKLEDLIIVDKTLNEDGVVSDVIDQIGSETVNRVSLQSLKPKNGLMMQ